MAAKRRAEKLAKNIAVTLSFLLKFIFFDQRQIGPGGVIRIKNIMRKTTPHFLPEELIVFAQEYGDSKRAQALYDLDSDDEEEEKIDPNPKLVQGGVCMDDHLNI